MTHLLRPLLLSLRSTPIPFPAVAWCRAGRAGGGHSVFLSAESGGSRRRPSSQRRSAMRKR
eukprot:1418332-Rhodomonas_salina.1